MKKEKVPQEARNKGIIIVLVLVFGTVFLVLSTGLLSFISLQHRISLRKVAWNDSLHIAEAGVNYYRWHLNQYIEAENPDIQDGKSWCCKVGGVEYGQDADQCRNGDFIICGTCDGEACYEHDYYNPQGELTGKFVLEIKAKKICGQILGVYINSTGSTIKYPNLKRKVEAKFASTSVADYAYMLNDGVWAGSDREIYGKYHSNSGIRMDGTHNSLVTSSVNDWLCTSSFSCSSASCPEGCNPEGANCRCDGVCGTGSPKDLWRFPIPPFDFDGITADLNRMKNLANDKGIYFPPSTGEGYHVIFKDSGKFDIKIVTGLGAIRAYSMEQGWHWSYERITAEEDFQLDVSLPSGCGLIFVEDDLWVEGTVKGKITIASADLISVPSIDTSVFLNGNLDYTLLDGSDSLAVITEKDVLIPLYSPNEMILRGVFVAQKGHFGREHYSCGNYWPECKRDELIMYGSVVSNGRVGTKWTYYGGTWASGYNQRKNYFDAKLSRDPPPLLPYVSKELKLISWEEIQ